MFRVVLDDLARLQGLQQAFQKHSIFDHLLMCVLCDPNGLCRSLGADSAQRLRKIPWIGFSHVEPLSGVVSLFGESLPYANTTEAYPTVASSARPGQSSLMTSKLVV